MFLYSPAVIHFTELFPQAILDEMLASGHIKAVKHPTFPLTLYGYTEKAAYERVWNEATRQCRGLIVDNNGIVVARPFPKFFNIDEPDAAKFDADDLVEVSDKHDGSMGVGLWFDGEYHVATRGSFTSPQALHATKRFREQMASGLIGVRYSGDFADTSVSRIFEIIYPENRIVLDYGDKDELVYLGSIDIATGNTIDAPGDAAVYTYADALSLPVRDNAEGYVLRKVSTNERLKIKYETYKALHRIITQCSARTLWELLSVNAIKAIMPDAPTKDLAARLKLSQARVEEIDKIGPTWENEFSRPGMPVTFSQWVVKEVFAMCNAVAVTRNAIAEEHGRIIAKVGSTDRKAYAIEAKNSIHKSALFNILDGREYESYCWLQHYPEHRLPFADVG